MTAPSGSGLPAPPDDTAEDARGYADVVPEEAREMCGRGEAEAHADRGDGLLATHDGLDGLLDPDRVQEDMRRGPVDCSNRR